MIPSIGLLLLWTLFLKTGPWYKSITYHWLSLYHLFNTIVPVIHVFIQFITFSFPNNCFLAFSPELRIFNSLSFLSSVNSSIICILLLRSFSFSISPSTTSCSRHYFWNMSPIQFPFIFTIVLSRVFYFPLLLITSSFVTLYVQFIFFNTFKNFPSTFCRIISESMSLIGIKLCSKYNTMSFFRKSTIG